MSEQIFAAAEALRLPDAQRDGYHQCWYPVAMSSEVAPEKVISKEFLDGRIAVWRGRDGVARVHSAFCRHMGADLAVGQVEGNNLRCIFHRWEYGGDGRCVKIPVTNTVPPRARLFNFPTEEKWGLIWAFNGETPLYEVPHFPTFKEEQIAHSVFECKPLPVPHWLIVGNTHDFQHVQAVHHATMEKEPEDFDIDGYTIEFKNEVTDPNLGFSKQHFKLFGTNTVAFENRFERMLIMSLYSGTPINGGRTKGYTVTATPRMPGVDVQKILARGEEFGKNIMAEDDVLLETIRFKPEMLIAADKHLLRWLQRAARFPAAHPSKPFIS
ncbi:MAG TPA: aromatic ring-hydroxylating dioxygenase subunit alpha [Steroidobacteraceae bacterium]|nr:aromatic ring-hydroxylating dioxygenase subunit alpha [Steroidobacteraceae bacterium]